MSENEIKILKMQDRKGHVTESETDMIEFQLEGEDVIVSINGVLMWVSTTELSEVVSKLSAQYISYRRKNV